MSETKPKTLLSQTINGDNNDNSDLNSSESTSNDQTQKMSNVQNVNGNSVVLGQLPDDFLRLDSSSPTNQTRSQIELDEELAASLQRQYDSQLLSQQRAVANWNSNYRAHLSITFVEAHLIKNYGLMNMSPYVRIRIGNTIYETRTSTRGGKNPKWNETCRCYLPIGCDTIAIELYDDCLFTQDELIAWATYKVPENFLRFTSETPEHTFEERIVLSGKQGEGLEGELFISVNSKPVTAETLRTYMTAPVYHTSHLHGPGVLISTPPILAAPLIVHQSPVPAATLLPPSQQTQHQAAVQQPPQPIQIRDEDVQTLKEMFPNIEIDVIKSVLQTERGNIERSITNLLELNSTT
uniref:Toll-interacting protein B-like n=1 Tax=Dermatophagoides pteronyssinus TaxID=6956 RepID=A0A6P6YHD0_DERPT|nr:toll-interacting protein B-like [Dermatophagoides pteronyssinus]